MGVDRVHVVSLFLSNLCTPSTNGLSLILHNHHLPIRSLLTKLSLGITLVVRIKESESSSYQEKTSSGKQLD